MRDQDVILKTSTSNVVAANTNDCYSAGERSWMERGQHLRAKLLRPLLDFLTTIRIRPDHLTLLSVAFGLGFSPWWQWNFFGAAIVFLVIHVLLDGLDGPLARHQSVAGPRGSFTDTFGDQIVVTAVTISLMLGPTALLSVVAGTLFLVLYTVVVAMAMVRNSLRIPYRWLVRPRFFVFLAIPIQLLGVPGAVPITVWLSNALMAILVATGFYRLRNRLRGPREI